MFEEPLLGSCVHSRSQGVLLLVYLFSDVQRLRVHLSFNQVGENVVVGQHCILVHSSMMRRRSRIFFFASVIFELVKIVFLHQVLLQVSDLLDLVLNDLVVYASDLLFRGYQFEPLGIELTLNSCQRVLNDWILLRKEVFNSGLVRVFISYRLLSVVGYRNLSLSVVEVSVHIWQLQLVRNRGLTSIS
jgi:hypothetical protein